MNESIGKSTGFSVIAPLVLAQFAISSDITTTAMATKSLQADLAATMPDIQLMNMIFGLVAGMFMIAGGFAGVATGWRTTFRMGSILALLGDVTMALAPSMAAITWVGRVLVGMGASLLVPSILGIVPILFQGRSRATAFACITAGTGAAALTPVPYGIVLDMAGFRVAFLISASFFALLLVLSRTIPDVKGVETLRFDTIGFLLSSGGLFFVLMGVALIPTHGLLLASRTASLSFWGISPCAPLLSIGSGMLFAFIHHEKMREAQGAPALMPSVFFSSAAARHALVAVAFPFFLSGSMNIAVIPFMQMVANATAIESGLLLACAGMPMIALAVGIPRFAPKAPAKAVIRIGYVTGAAGMAVIAWAMARPDPLMLTCIGMLVAGAGMGTVNSQANNAMATAVGEKNAPQSGGIQGTARDIAHSLSTALVGAMLSFFLAHSFGIAIQPAIAIDSTSRLDISSEELTLMDDESFLGMLDTIELDGEAERTVLKAYQDARTHASQLVLMALSAGTICLILFTSGLPSAPLKLPR